MNLEKYTVTANLDFLEYKFYSEGRNGKIEKRIRLEKVSDKPKVYNLAFGDLNPITGLISDMSISDNQDVDKILSTVGSSVIDFFNNHPEAKKAMVVASGSTESRTRLCQM